MENSHLMILALTDGKAGHETQTKGIVTLLNNGNQYEVQWLKIYKVSKLTKHILKAFLAIVSPKWALGFYLDTVQLQALQSDNILLVSAGGETLLPNVLLKKYFRQQGKATKNVVATSLRGIPACYFDAVFTIDDKYKNQKPFIYYTLIISFCRSLFFVYSILDKTMSYLRWNINQNTDYFNVVDPQYFYPYQGSTENISLKYIS